MQEKLSVIGAGISGVGAAILAAKHNYSVFVSDSNSISSSDKIKFDNCNISWEENGHTSSLILSSDLIVKSPGIADSTAIISEINKKNIQIISEIEFASRYTNAKIIAITGTNGKTTTSMLTANKEHIQLNQEHCQTRYVLHNKGQEYLIYGCLVQTVKIYINCYFLLDIID